MKLRTVGGSWEMRDSCMTSNDNDDDNGVKVALHHDHHG